MIAGVITAAGSSHRMGGQKKEYICLAGKPILMHAIKPFLAIPDCLRIIVTVPSGHCLKAETLLKPHLNLSRLHLIEGGTTRQESVFKALEVLETYQPDYVLIHDGARPWITVKLIEIVLEAVGKHGACIPAIELTEAPKLINASGKITESLLREHIRLAQTPQGFIFSKILEAHRRAAKTDRQYIDDAEVYAKYIGPVFTVPGDNNNKKVTYKGDMQI